MTDCAALCNTAEYIYTINYTRGAINICCMGTLSGKYMGCQSQSFVQVKVFPEK